jgi:transforming growth factor-beta-induced protein
MRKFLAFVSILALSALAFASFAVPAAQAQESEPTIVEIAASNEDFSTLVAAVQAAGLADTLAGEGDFTVFAPTNDAFDALFASLGIAPEDLLADKPLLTEVLLYHVALGELTSEEVAYLGELRMANGDLSTISVRDGSPYINDARIIATDIMASNGVIHVIDAVILPSGIPAPGGAVDANIVEIAVANDGFSTLVAAVLAADLDGALSTEGPFTVFAPSNDGFNKTLGELGLSADDLLGNKELLTDILLYHVAAGALDAQDVLGMGEITMLNGDTATAEVIDGVAYIAGVPISNANIRTSNGIIHVIDAVMLPPAE